MTKNKTVSKGDKIIRFMRPSIEGYSRKVSVKDFEKAGLSEAGNGWPTLRKSGSVNRRYVVSKTYKGGELASVELLGTRPDSKTSVYVPVEIRKWHNDNTREKGCAECGSHRHLQLDHCVPPERKHIPVGDLTPADFQWLCTHHNDKKREACNVCIQTGRRHPAPSGFDPQYTQGGEKWSESLGCTGCHLKDPIAFRKGFVLASSLGVKP